MNKRNLKNLKNSGDVFNIGIILDNINFDFNTIKKYNVADNNLIKAEKSRKLKSRNNGFIFGSFMEIILY